MPKIVKLSVCCKICGGLTLIKNVDLDGYNAWHAGTEIQKALPDLSPEDHELMVTNIDRHCWNGMFAELEKDQQEAEDSLDNQSLVKRMPDYERKTGKSPT